MLLGGVVDSHVHVWDAGRAHYPWLAEAAALRPAYDLDEVEAEQVATGVGQVVLVQAADDLADTALMLEAARRHPRVAGVVAWVPLDDPARAAAVLEGWRDEPVVGVRHLVHRDPDPDLLLRPAVRETLDLVAARGLAFDVCAESAHLLGLLPRLAERHPGLRLVVDHLGKPPIRDGGWQPWASLLAAAAQAPSVVAKVSGLNTAAGPGWRPADLVRYVDHALALFGPDRLMYGGDWPFALLAADSYTQVWEGLRHCLAGLDDTAAEAVWAGTARRTYRLPAPPAGR